jgi:hypothetical protein
MATAVWQDASADWDDTDNWSGGAGAGGVPANNDTVIIASGTQDITTNLTTGLTGITLKISSGYTGKIGTSSTWLDIDGGTFDFNSGGDVYATGVWTTVSVVGGVSSANMLQLRGNATTDIGTLTCQGGLGTVTVGDNAVLDTVEMFGCRSLTVDINGVSSLDNVTMDAGILDVSGAIAATLEVIGGFCTVSGTATVVTVDLQEGGRMAYTSSGTITTLNAYGVFDGTNNMNSSVTVTNCTTYDSATLLLKTGLGNWTFSNPITYNGGDIQFPAGSTLTVA